MTPARSLARATGAGTGAGAAGFSLIELLLAMAVGTLVMGATMAGLSDALRANQAVVMVSGMNNTLRVAMDLMVRDFLQVGSGLPPGHFILTPSGLGSTQIRLPGPPGTAFLTVAGDLDMGAVIPGNGLGPMINGVATDTITVLTADNTFTNVVLTAVTDTTVDVDPIWDIGTGPDRVTPGQLLMVSKGSGTTLVQVTGVNVGARQLTFANVDSLNLNQTGAAAGNLAALNAATPRRFGVPAPNAAEVAAAVAATTVTRIRMISYYLDATDPARPRLVRRINNGHEIDFDNSLGTAVAMDVENLQFDYDLAAGTTNPANVQFNAADLGGTGACAPDPCAVNLIRKVNIRLSAHSRNADVAGAKVYRNTLTSQVSLRGMAFVNEYQPGS